MKPTDVDAVTWLVAAGRPDRPGEPLNAPLVPASNFLLGTGRVYSRDGGTPGWDALETLIGGLEGGEAVAFASGMAGIFSTFGALLGSGDHVVSARSVFGSTHALFTKYLPKWNISTSYFNIEDVDTVEDLIHPNTKILFAETPTNPGLDILDLEFLGRVAKKHKLILVIDNCFATPYLQQPIRFGADLVIHSGTKLMDGQGRVLAGITVGSHDLIDRVYRFARITGPALSPFHAWLLSKSLETLSVRMEAHCRQALALAQWLERQAQP
mgnify:CR=1 FL=1